MTSASIKSLVLPCVESRPKLSRRLWVSVPGGNLRKSCWYDRDVVPREYSLSREKRESRITGSERIEERCYMLNGRILARFSIFTCACLFSLLCNHRKRNGGSWGPQEFKEYPQGRKEFESGRTPQSRVEKLILPVWSGVRVDDEENLVQNM